MDARLIRRGILSVAATLDKRRQAEAERRARDPQRVERLRHEAAEGRCLTAEELRLVVEAERR